MKKKITYTDGPVGDVRVIRDVREGSPFDVPGVKTGATTADILAAVKESRSKTSRRRHPRRRG